MSVSPDELAATLMRRASAQHAADERARETCLGEVERVLRASRVALGFERAWVIGSLAWGSFGLRSDIDVVIAGAIPAVLIELSDRIGRATSRSVDVLALEGLPSRFRQRVLSEGRLVP
jgi:predicted nucleotidyltransferase